MPHKKGTKLMDGEAYSVKYKGYIKKSDGAYRKRFQWINKKGDLRSGNRYYVEVECANCGNLHLNDKTNIKNSALQFCSNECVSKSRIKKDGLRKRKRGSGTDSHNMIKQSSHPFANADGYIAEHRLVMEQYIGRYLKPSERVHHINCKKRDNRIENLFLCESNSEHHLIHGSLNKCVDDLINMGVIALDKELRRYVIARHGAGV